MTNLSRCRLDLFYKANISAVSNVSCNTKGTNTMQLRPLHLQKLPLPLIFSKLFHLLLFPFLTGGSVTCEYLFCFFLLYYLAYKFQQHTYSCILHALLGITEVTESIHYRQVCITSVMILVTTDWHIIFRHICSGDPTVTAGHFSILFL